MSPIILHYMSSAIAVAFSSFGTALGQGIASYGAIASFERQTLGNAKGFRTLLLGLAFLESGGILGLVISLMLLFVAPTNISWGIAWAELGIALAIGISGFIAGIASSFSVEGACRAISRQPFFSQKIVTLMLITQSMIESVVIFSFIICLMIRVNITTYMSTAAGIKYCFAGLIIGIGSLGPSIGQAFFSRAALCSVGINRKAYQRIFAFSMLSQAIIGTPVIFSLLLSVLVIYRPITISNIVFSVAALAGSTFAIALGSIGAGVGTGYVASRSCYQLALREKSQGVVFRATLLGQVFIESAVIYCLIVALLLVMRVG